MLRRLRKFLPMVGILEQFPKIVLTNTPWGYILNLQYPQGV